MKLVYLTLADVLLLLWIVGLGATTERDHKPQAPNTHHELSASTTNVAERKCSRKNSVSLSIFQRQLKSGVHTSPCVVIPSKMALIINSTVFLVRD